MAARKKKVHINTNGRLLNMGKQWRDLTLKQRDYIAVRLSENVKKYIKENENADIKSIKEQVYQHTWRDIEERGIWIPQQEFKRYFISRFSRYANKHLSNIINSK